MKLADLITGGQLNNASPQVRQAAPQGAQSVPANRQVQTLAPGQTIQGEVVGRNGSEVQIKLADDTVINARVDQNVNLEMGKNVTFEVRSNGRALTLSPLFANTATDVNVLKALDMASLPANQNTVAMTELMMRAGLPVDRNSLQHLYREVNAFQNAGISDIVDLHKLGLPVNEENLAQIDSYKNLTHQLVNGLHEVVGSVPETLQNMMQEGNTTGAAGVFQELLLMIQELPQEEPAAQAAADAAIPPEEAELLQAQEGAQGQSADAVAADAEGKQASVALRPDGAASADGSAAIDAEAGTDKTDVFHQQLSALGESAESAKTETLMAMAEKREIAGKDAAAGEAALIHGRESAEAPAGESEPQALTRELTRLLGDKGNTPQMEGWMNQLAAAEEKGDLVGQARVLQQILQQGIQEKDQPLLEGMLSGKAVQKMLTKGLSKLWTIEPKEVADEGKVDELYQRLDRQLKSLTRVLEQGRGTESGTYKAVNNMTQNLDFLQQLNQAYTYVQLPLRLQQGDAHGDLYVYTNKRNLAAKDGQISALLHLDMEHLGPVDVYVAMQAEKVNTRFYVQDDEMLDFLEQHMDLLTQRLQKRGYQCNFEMQVRQKEAEPESGLKGLLAQESAGIQQLGRYAFDMRA